MLLNTILVLRVDKWKDEYVTASVAALNESVAWPMEM